MPSLKKAEAESTPLELDNLVRAPRRGIRAPVPVLLSLSHFGKTMSADDSVRSAHHCRSRSAMLTLCIC
ncbi:hypothetical protein AV530_012182 [Patagioenas fasciata monilis]|uniref:Uncharacterized protein n=1 Tax=Patagioenas fasciata monilis TaxID=372326 RepID=A0A1V4KDI5_PATFA|nr:hypothetical protein AV530_012182 [Patagioenas fasciata monilis]